MQKHQIEALTLLGQSTRGSFDPWDLTGPHNSGIRARIMALWFDLPKFPRKDAGVTAIQMTLHAAANVPGATPYARSDAFAAWARGLVNQA